MGEGSEENARLRSCGRQRVSGGRGEPPGKPEEPVSPGRRAENLTHLGSSPGGGGPCLERSPRTSLVSPSTQGGRGRGQRQRQRESAERWGLGARPWDLPSDRELLPHPLRPNSTCWAVSLEKLGILSVLGS